MSHSDQLREYGRAYINVTELQQVIREADYLLFQRMVEQMVEVDVLVPVKSAGKNGRLPPLWNKYRIFKPPEDYSQHLMAIRQLNPALNISGYLQRPDLYLKHMGIVDGLSKYLWYSANLLEQPMARKERSFSIWGQEKMLDEKYTMVKEVLKFNNLGEDYLNYYETPEPFFEYVHARQAAMTVLILENKDTWFTFRKLLQATDKHILAGTPVDVLLYGEGNKITKPAGLEQYQAAMLQGKTGQACSFLYCGDLDYEGIRLFFRAREANPSLDIRPLAGLYLLMLELAAGVDLPLSRDGRGVDAPLDSFASMLGLDHAGVMIGLLTQGRYIPQEILNYQVVAGILK